MDNFDQYARSSRCERPASQYDQLRHIVVSLLTLVFVLSGTMNLYLLRQCRS